MATRYSPRIVTDGLVLYLDAANSRSYPGTGTAWFDLTGRGNNAVLTNGPVFSSGGSTSEGAGGKYFLFDGGNDYASIDDSADWSFGTGDFAIDWWMALIGTSQIGYAGYIGTFVDHWTNGNWIIMNSTNGDNVRLYAKDGEGDEGQLTPYFQLGDTNWHHLCLTRVGNTGYLYIDTVQEATGDLTNKGVISDDSNPLTIGRAGGVYSGINISNIKIYKGKSLSTSEVKQNYNAQKGRFGL